MDKYVKDTVTGFESELQNSLHFTKESNRRNSFKSWVFPENKKCNASKLAEAGFHFIGSDSEPDAVQCFLCKKPLDGWEEGDDPWLEHRKHSPNCLYVQFSRPESKLTIYESVDIYFKVIENYMHKLFANETAVFAEMGLKIRKELQNVSKHK